MIEQGDLELKQLDWIKRVRALSEAVTNERLHQWGKYGYQRHQGTEWLAILGKQFGDVSGKSCKLFMDKRGDPILRSELRAELIQVAAVAIAFAQAIDTGEA